MPTVAQLFKSIPQRFKSERAAGVNSIVNFELIGDDVFHYSVAIVDGKCFVYPELHTSPDCIVKAKAIHYVKLETGKLNPQLAILSGKVKVSNLNEMLRFTKFFRKYNEGHHTKSKPERPIQEGPLAGIRILDLTRLLPGPLGTMLLGEMGAEIIKIEDPDAPDYVRNYPPFVNEISANYLGINRTKKSLTLNIFSEKGKAKFLELVRSADVIIEQFRPNVLEKNDLGFEGLKKINDQIVYISLTGYGQSGPYSQKAGHDLNYLATSGILSLIQDDQQKPVIPGIQIADVAGGSYMMVAACTTALLARNKDKQAQYVDVAMLDGIMPFLSLYHSQYQADRNEVLNKKPMLGGRLANYNVYQCKDQKWLALGALEPKFWTAFCQMIDKTEWSEWVLPDLAEKNSLKEKLKKLFLTKTQKEWLHLAEGKEVCLSAVNTIEEAMNDPQIKARNLIITHIDTKGNQWQGLGNPIKFNNYKHTVSWPAPDLGEDQSNL